MRCKCVCVCVCVTKQILSESTNMMHHLAKLCLCINVYINVYTSTNIIARSLCQRIRTLLVCVSVCTSHNKYCLKYKHDAAVLKERIRALSVYICMCVYASHDIYFLKYKHSAELVERIRALYVCVWCMCMCVYASHIIYCLKHKPNASVRGAHYSL